MLNYQRVSNKQWSVIWHWRYHGDTNHHGDVIGCKYRTSRVNVRAWRMGKQPSIAGGGVVVSLLGWNMVTTMRELIRYQYLLGELAGQVQKALPFEDTCVTSSLHEVGWVDMVESLAFWGAFVNPCELLVSPTIGSLFRRFCFVEMIENLWELAHLPNSASRWVMRWEGSSYARRLFQNSKATIMRM